MENNEFVNYINQNLKELYDNFKEIFKFSSEEYANLLKKIIKDILKDSFYKDLVNNNTIDFNKESLLDIKEFLYKLNINEKQIKEIIITIPEIVLFNKMINNIFPIYKNNNFKGLAFVYNNDYRSYSYSNSSYKLNNLNNIVDQNVNYYNYVIDNLLKSLEREDIKSKYDIDENAPLNEKFISLSKDYSKKNYYFKKIL